MVYWRFASKHERSPHAYGRANEAESGASAAVHPGGPRGQLLARLSYIGERFVREAGRGCALANAGVGGGIRQTRRGDERACIGLGLGHGLERSLCDVGPDHFRARQISRRRTLADGLIPESIDCDQWNDSRVVLRAPFQMIGACNSSEPFAAKLDASGLICNGAGSEIPSCRNPAGGGEELRLAVEQTTSRFWSIG
jgi:hypothetical protein